MQTVLLDVDDVVTDFFEAALRCHGRKDLIKSWPVGEWDMPKVMGITIEELWEPLDTYAFWSTQPLIPGAREFVAQVKEDTRKAGAELLFCTVASHNPQCSRAKIELLQREFGVVDEYIIMGRRRKALFAHKNCLLVDDNADSIREFIDAEGYGMLFPTNRNVGVDVVSGLCENHGTIYNYVRSQIWRFLNPKGEFNGQHR